MYTHKSPPLIASDARAPVAVPPTAVPAVLFPPSPAFFEAETVSHAADVAIVVLAATNGFFTDPNIGRISIRKRSSDGQG